ncbi:MAG: M48 family metallopeptidase [Burkholderiales bacterium]
MDSQFDVHDFIDGAQSVGRHRHCRCQRHARRRFGGALLAAAALPAAALAQSIPECKRSTFTKMVSAQQVEQAANQQYRQMLQQASSKQALVPKDHPQVVRLRAIAQRIIPFTGECNPDAKNWQWEVNLLGSQELNAFCMPGGKIAFYYGILSKLQLDDDEVAAIMGHEISHALLEHAREQTGKNTATQLTIGIGAALLGLGSTGRAVGDLTGQLLSLTYSRDDESQADRLGMIMAAKAGYDPRAGVTLWKKMMAASKGAPPQFLSTHPSSENRIHDIEALLPRVEPIYAAAEKPPQRFGPPAPKAAASSASG